MKKALFFDLDGTLWDARKSLVESYNLTMEKLGLGYRFDFAMVNSYMGLTPLETVKLAFKDICFDDNGNEIEDNIQKGLDIFKKMVQDEIEYLSLRPGSLYPNEEETLEKLSKKYKLYIVSNAEKGYIENFLNCYPNIARFISGKLCAGDTNLDKRDNIKLLMSQKRIKRVFYIGDTDKDRIESFHAGVDFIYASYGFGTIENNNIKYLIKDLPSLIDVLKLADN